MTTPAHFIDAGCVLFQLSEPVIQEPRIIRHHGLCAAEIIVKCRDQSPRPFILTFATDQGSVLYEYRSAHDTKTVFDAIIDSHAFKGHKPGDIGRATCLFLLMQRFTSHLHAVFLGGRLVEPLIGRSVVISHGGQQLSSPYLIHQHGYRGYEDGGGYSELLEVLDSPDPNQRFVTHLFLSQEGRHYLWKHQTFAMGEIFWGTMRSKAFWDRRTYMRAKEQTNDLPWLYTNDTVRETYARMTQSTH